MTMLKEIHKLSAREEAVLQTFADSKGEFFVANAFVDLSRNNVSGTSVSIHTRDDGVIRLFSDWYTSSVGNQYAMLAIDDHESKDAQLASVEVCHAWLSKADILSVEFARDDVIVDAGIEFTSHTGERSFVVVDDPRDHSDHRLLVTNSEPYWLLSGLPIHRRPLKS